LAVGQDRLAGAVRRRALAQRGEPLEVGALVPRLTAGIGHVGEPGHHGRLARRRRAHLDSKLTVLAQLDARKPAPARGPRVLGTDAQGRERLRIDAVLTAGGSE